MATAELKAVITADDRATPVLAKFRSSAEKVNNVLGTGLKVALAGATAGFGALVGVGISSANAFAEAQEAGSQLNAVLKSTKGIAGVTADQASKLATELQNVTKFSDETILSGENMLLTFTGIGKDVFPQATETMLNMSQALGQDVKGSAIQLGKALNDPINGVTALRRVGVSFTEDQQKMIEKLVQSGKTLDAQKMILKELEIEFGNSARAAGETFSGKLTILQNKIGDLQEKIGEAIINGITPFIDKINAWVSSPQGVQFVENLAAAIQHFSTVTLPAFFAQMTVIIGKTGEVVAWYRQHADTINNILIPAITGITVAVGIFKTALFIDAAIQTFTSGLALMRGAAALATGQVGGLSLALKLLPLNIVITVGAIGIMALWNQIKGLNEDMAKLDQSQRNLNATTDKAIARARELRAEGRGEAADRILKSLVDERAIGGPITAGRPYIVGERGPEVIVPNQSGNVIPNNQLGGANVSVNFNGPISMNNSMDVEEIGRIISRQIRLVQQGAA